MSKSRCVEPETIRLDLSEGDWIDVKTELTYGEEQRLAGAAMTSMNVQSEADKAKTQAGDGEGVRVNLENERYAILRLYTWLVDWSFETKEGRRVKVSRDAIANLTADTAHEIDDALSGYIERRDAEKNAGTPPSKS